MRISFNGEDRIPGQETDLSTEIRTMSPRTRARIDSLGWRPERNVTLIDPVGYIEFLALQMHATLVVR